MRIGISIVNMLLFCMVIKAQSSGNIVLPPDLQGYEESDNERIKQLRDLSKLNWYNLRKQKEIYQQVITELYLEDGNWKKADESYRNLFKISPRLKINTDAVSNEFLQFSKNYEVFPKWSFLLSIAGVKTNRIFGNSYQVEDVQVTYENFESKISLDRNLAYSVGVNYFFNENIGLGLEGNYTSTWLDYLGSYENALYLDGNRYSLNLSFDEIQNWVSIPVYIKYSLPFKKGNILSNSQRSSVFDNLEAFIYGGVSFDFLMFSRFDNLVLLNPDLVKFTVANDIKLIHRQEDEPDLRKDINYSILGGIGINYNLSKITLFLDTRFSWNQLNQVLEKNRFDNDRLSSVYNYLDNNIKDNRMLVSVGARYSIFSIQRR